MSPNASAYSLSQLLSWFCVLLSSWICHSIMKMFLKSLTGGWHWLNPFTPVSVTSSTGTNLCRPGSPTSICCVNSSEILGIPSRLFTSTLSFEFFFPCVLVPFYLGFSFLLCRFIIFCRLYVAMTSLLYMIINLIFAALYALIIRIQGYINPPNLTHI